MDDPVRLAVERGLAGEAFVECHAQAVDIGAGRGPGLAAGLFGADVRRRAGQDALARLAGGLGLEPRQAEIADLGSPGGRVDEDIRGLDVAVDQPGRVGGLDAGGGLGDQLGGLAGGMRPRLAISSARLGPATYSMTKYGTRSAGSLVVYRRTM